MKTEIKFLSNNLGGIDEILSLQSNKNMSARSLAPDNPIPGHSYLGKTYHVVNGSETPHPEWFKKDLIDRKSLDWSESSVAGKIYRVPNILGTADDINQGHLRIIESDSTETFASKLNTNVEASGSYGFFSGSIDSNFETNQSRYSNRKFGSATDFYQIYSIGIVDSDKMRKNMKPEILDIIENGAPDDIIEKLGTHYIAGIIIGGRAESSFTIDTSSYHSSMSISSVIEASYTYGIGKASGKLEAEYEQAKSNWEHSTRKNIQVIGGDSTLARAIMNGKYDDWLQSVKKTPSAVRFTSNGLLGIWNLATDEKQKIAIKRAAIRFINTYQPVAKAPQLPLQRGDLLALTAANGKYVTNLSEQALFIKNQNLVCFGKNPSECFYEVKSVDGNAFTLESKNNNRLVIQMYEKDVLAYNTTINPYTWWIMHPAKEGRYRIQNKHRRNYMTLANNNKFITAEPFKDDRNSQFDVQLFGPKFT
ncbi:MAC/perforin domain-containing protein [Marinicella sp. W31]|uniref:MAC/perforin domain-containing protein n=1 Tax=Marinicella sp. W31 TaxID=3023713 RepID=UPI003756843A